MVDRTDIDALLIGALYGELTPADEARLMAHLESHPADRTALDDLTRTRAAVRESRLLAFQLEPPQAISALLLQEAARRAPRAVTDRGDGATWFQRFVRTFMAHPAMAAAATLVLVITAAGTLYLRGTDQFARSEAPSVALERAAAPGASGAMAPSAAPAAPMAEPVASPPATPSAPPSAPQAGALAGSSGERAAAPNEFRFDGASATGAAAQDKAARQVPGEVDQVQDPGPSGRASYEKTKGAGQSATQAELSKLGAATKPARPRPTKPEAVHGIELRTPQLQPKDLADDEKPAAGRRQGAAEIARDQRNAAGAGGAPATPPASVPPPPPAPARAPANAPGAGRAAGPAAAADFDASQLQQAPTAPAAAANAAKRPSPKQSVNQLPPSTANNAVNARTDRRLGKTANTANTENTVNGDARQVQSVLEWARKQREQVIAHVNANRCREAATAAVEIYNRAPEYYNANVATDRQIKPCLAYVAAERERADRSRASNKNAADVQTPAQAAPSRK